MASIAEINVRIGARIESMTRDLKKAERQLQMSGRKMSQLGSELTATVSLPIIGIGIAGGKMAKDLEASFAKIENLVGVSGSVLDSFKVGISSLSNQVGKSQGELSDALFTITSAGLRGKEAMELLTISSKASVLGMGETKEIAKAATAVLQAYGKENITVSEAVNILTKTVREGNLEASELAPSIGKVLPIAAQLGVNFKEVGANIAVFTRLGVSAGESVSALKALMTNIIKPSKAASETLAKFGLSAQDVRDSIKKNGLAATLQDLLKKFDGNIESASNLFGSVEGLANILGTAGSQSEEYTRIVASMSDGMDIVESGFQKASETADQKLNKALVRLQNIGISIGNVVLPIFIQVADVVADWAEKFSNLSESTQRTIIKVAALVATVGPLVKVYGVLKLTMASLKAAQISMLANFKSISGGIITAAANFRKLNLVMQASVIGLVIAAVAGAVAIFNTWNDKISETQRLKNALNSVAVKAAQNIVEEKMKVEALVDVIKDENTSRADKKRAIQDLQKISPQYFGGLDTEKSKIEDVTTAMDGYIANILKMAKGQAVKERLIEIQKELLNTEGVLDKTEVAWSDLSAVAIRMTTLPGTNRDTQLANLWAQRANDYRTGLESEMAALTNTVKKEKLLFDQRSNNAGASPAAPTITASGSPSTITAADTPSRAKIEVLDIKSLAEQKQKSEELFSALSSGFMQSESMQARFKEQQLASTEATKLMIDQIATTPEHYEAMRLGIERVRLEMEQMNEQEKRFKAMKEAADAASAAIEGYAAQGGQSLLELGKTALKAAADFVRAQMMQAVSSFIAKTIAISGPIGILIAGGASAIIGTLFNKAIGSLGVPALAEGGLAYGPTLAMVGDNKGARTNPEVIAPLSKLKGMMDNGGGNMITPNFEISHRIVGDDILVIVRSANEKLKRRSGTPAFAVG